MIYRIWFWIAVELLFLVITLGFVLPSLISARDWSAVGLGFVLGLFVVIPIGLYALPRHIYNMVVKRWPSLVAPQNP